MEKSIGFQKRVLLVCFLLTLGAWELRAQSYTPVPYNFGGVSEVTDDTVPPLQAPTDLTMDCLAANGYGQWTASYKTQNAFPYDSGSPGLFLLANALRAPTDDGSTGIVSSRPFQYSESTNYPVDSTTTNRSVVKNVTNLKGRVRYVWPSADHQFFIVEGFNECPPNGNPAGLDGINLEFASYPYNATYGSGNQLLGKDVIKTPYPTGTYIINISISSHRLVSAAHEPDPRDWFSLAMDTMNLYIAYEEYDSTGHYNIWEITESLATGLSGIAIKVASGARRPTIAADVRRSVTDTLSKACFDVAYITGFLPVSEHLTWYNYDGSRTPAADTMEMTYNCQDTSGGTWSYTSVTHACMLDATWENIASSDTTPRAIYAIVSDAPGHTDLILFKIKDGAQDAAAYYCDGYRIVNHATGVNDAKFPVIDKPIRAFVNAYDGQKNDNFDEYHAMYQLARTYGHFSHKPLMMIHGAMVHDTLGPRVCLNFAGTNTTPGTVINRPDTLHRFYADPGLNTDGGDTDNYVGAVNQMGIHTHWRNGKEHYYLRDQRKLDEDIEENTLATESVFIDDGTSHGGTIGATVLPGKTMTLWTDRTVPYDGLPGNCTVFFPSTGANHATVKLVSGTGSDTASKIEAVWNADIYGDTTSQLLEINPNSSMDVYATMNCGIGLKMIGKGATMTGGTNNCPDSISSPAYLNLHGDAFFEPSAISVDSSIITCEHDQSLKNTDSSLTFATLGIGAACSITNSIVSNEDLDLPGSDTASIEMLGNSSWQNSLDTISIKNTLFNNGNIGVGIGTYPALPIEITSGKFNNTPIAGEFGPNIVTIESVLFDLTTFATAQINMGNFSYQTYDYLTISGCNFAKIPTGADAIYASGYATDSDVMQHLHIVGNSFPYTDGTSPRAAVEFANSEGEIEQNSITGSYQYGVYISGVNNITNLLTKSLICSNHIRSCTVAGIYTDHTQGYGKLNNVGVVGAAHISGIEDRAKITFSNYSANDGPGIYVSDKTAWPDLTGVHSTTPDSIDYAAYDTIEWDGGNAMISLVKGGLIALGNGIEPWAWYDWCRNNILTFWSDDHCVCDGGGGGLSYVPLIVEDSGHSLTPLGNISHNYFGDSTILPENQDTGTGCSSTENRGTPSSWLVGDTTPVAAAGFCYFADSNFKTWQGTSPIECEASLPEKTKPKRINTLSILTDTSCREKYALGNSYIQNSDFADNVIADSILKEYLETCYDTGEAWQGFVDLDEANAAMSNDPARFPAYREWLKSVLWLNTIDPFWYCTCAESIYGTFYAVQAGANWNAEISAIEYLDSSSRCPEEDANYKTLDSQLLNMRHQHWLDTVKTFHNGDTTDFPEDTTIPTIDELGLSILRGPPAGVQNDTTPTSGISNLTASNNPFSKETTLYFTTGEYAYISFQVFDVLGRVVFGDYKGSVQPPGSYSFTVDGTNWSSGTYYARITTPLGETRMLKLVKE